MVQLLATGLALVLVLAPPRARDVPARLTDAAFWDLVTRASEGGGSFPSDNFVSNELALQTVLPRLARDRRTRGAYLGVGPDQNFTYIAALRPSIAFIVDIRRQNLLHHLLWKGLIEISPTRAELLARLFSRPKPLRTSPTDSVNTLVEVIGREAPSGVLFNANLDDVFDRLIAHRRLSLTVADRETIQMIYQAFFQYGFGISYAPLSSPVAGSRSSSFGLSMFPTYGELIVADDAEGVQWSYLATEASYAFLRDMQQRNLIVPIVGDFAGGHALPAIARYLQDHDERLATFYTSNVEQYLFQGETWRRLYHDVASFPLTPDAVFIRSYFPRTNAGGSPYSPASVRVPSRTLTASIQELLDGVDDDRLRSYADVIALSR